MPHFVPLGREVELSLLFHGSDNRDLLDDCQVKAGKRVDFLWVVCQKPDGRQTEIFQNLQSDSVVA